jgi:hypothetical protein
MNMGAAAATLRSIWVTFRNEKAPKEMIVAVHIIDLSSGMIRGIGPMRQLFRREGCST